MPKLLITFSWGAEGVVTDDFIKCAWHCLWHPVSCRWIQYRKDRGFGDVGLDPIYEWLIRKKSLTCTVSLRW